MKTISIKNNTFTLHPSGCMFWSERNMLLVADVHLGKIAHFRKHGAAVPSLAAFKNLEELTQVTNHFEPKTICFLGDLFHSQINEEWKDFEKWVDYIHPEIILIEGNHDIIPKHLYTAMGIKIYDRLILNGFLLTHHPTSSDGFFNFCGHIHPGIAMHGLGRQYLKLPCFYKSVNTLILPAFGNFTGKHILKPVPTDEVFVIADGEVIQV